jgi:hypothetical protein
MMLLSKNFESENGCYLRIILINSSMRTDILNFSLFSYICAARHLHFMTLLFPEVSNLQDSTL